MRRAALGLDGPAAAGGVLPERRGHGYAAGTLAEIIPILAVEPRAAALRAGIDLADQPAVVAFDRPGYRSRGRQLVLPAPRDA